MNALIAWSVTYRGLVAALSALALALGLWAASRASLDVFPEFVPPVVTIQTEAPGLSPEQVEQIITRPIETAVNGAPGLASLRSESIAGLSVVTLSFDDSADPHLVRQGVSEQISAIASTLPAGVAAPKLSPLTSSTMDVLKVGLTSDRLGPFELRQLANWEIRPRLLSVPGIARVTAFGGAVAQIQIQPDVNRLTALGLSLSDVATAARSALSLRGAGFIDTASQRIAITVPAPAPNPRDIAQTVVTRVNGVPVYLSTVATVTLAPELRVGDAIIQGKPGVLLTVSGQYGANTLAATKGLEAALAEITPGLQAQGVRVYPAMHRPATFVERALGNLEHALLLGCGLILLVLLAFLRSGRAALISFISIPLSIFAAIAVLDAMGQSLNTMTLGGFAVALGVLVDDAIIDIENILRRLRLNAAGSAPLPRLEVIKSASMEIRSSMIFGTLVILLVFLPVVFLGGVQGRFVSPLAISFGLAVLASLAVAMTVTPALCALLLDDAHDHAEPGWIVSMKHLHTRVLDFVARYFRWSIAILVAATLACVSILPQLAGEFMPQFREGHFVVHVTSTSAGLSLDEMAALGRRISRDLLRLPFIATVGQQIGRAEAGEDTWGPNRSEFHVELKADSKTDEAAAQNKIRAVLAGYPGISSEVLTFLGDRIGESISGETAQAVISVSGNSLDAIELTARAIGSKIEKVPGLVDLRVPQSEGAPVIALKLNPARLAAFGINSQDVLDTVQIAFAGVNVGTTYSGARTTEVVVILPPQVRNKLSALSAMTIGTAQTRVPLSQVASITLADSRASITHEAGLRRVNVTFNAGNRPLADVMRDAKAAIARGVPLPRDVYLSYGGAAAAEQASQCRLIILSALSFLLIVATLTLAFRRARLSTLVLVNVPFCLIGSIIAILLGGIGLTLGSLVGLVTVFGVGARNSIMLLSHVEHLIDVDGAPPTLATCQQAARERLVPVLMTALMAALGLVPLALGQGQAGYEIEAPMAITVLGGLVTATLLNLTVMPILSARLMARQITRR